MKVEDILSNITLLDNILLLIFFIGFSIAFFIAHRNERSTLDWTDMLLDTNTRKLSVSKLGNFMGIAISSWIMIYFVQVKDSYSMFPALFIAWLSFLGGVYTLNTFLKSNNKNQNEDSSTSTTISTSATRTTIPPVAPDFDAGVPPDSDTEEPPVQPKAKKPIKS